MNGFMLEAAIIYFQNVRFEFFIYYKKNNYNEFLSKTFITNSNDSSRIEKNYLKKYHWHIECIECGKLHVYIKIKCSS